MVAGHHFAVTPDTPSTTNRRPIGDGKTFYRGRFAPSPTGPLHFGSIVAAVGSYADARAHHGQWHLRIDDIDETRTVPGAESVILQTLEVLGFEWTGLPTRQIHKQSRYLDIINTLLDQNYAFPCGCSRRDVQRHAQSQNTAMIYPGTCREGLPSGRTGRTIRLHVPDTTCVITDRFLGLFEQNLAKEVGDFVVRRADGFAAYQLAVVVDDEDEGITHVVRGADLLSSTPRQQLLQTYLGFAMPTYAHLPVVIDSAGHKLSKQNAAHPIPDTNPLLILIHAWKFLGQVAPSQVGNVDEFWEAATCLWSPERIPQLKSYPMPRLDAGV
ncbi:MAG TPA: tRNA glutamyl-Q(34) synthetase GluQRS [Gammaproteobacteria bacterium]|nr:tRNA glutamyl-Q(34) synthetase GluQRS [Gammaproteobacteria bacterium]